jgi:hypothetical protein
MNPDEGEEPCGHAPLDRASDPGRVAEAVGVAGADEVLGVVQALDEGSAHGLSLGRHVALAPRVLLQQSRAEFLEARRRLIQCSDDRLALGDVKAKDPHVAFESIAEPCRGRVVIELVGDPGDVLAAGRDAGQHDRGRGVLASRVAVGHVLLALKWSAGSAAAPEPTL